MKFSEIDLFKVQSNKTLIGKYRIISNDNNFSDSLLMTGGEAEFNVRLVAKKYVEKGSTLLLRCDNDVQKEILYKVSEIF